MGLVVHLGLGSRPLPFLGDVGWRSPLNAVATVNMATSPVDPPSYDKSITLRASHSRHFQNDFQRKTGGLWPYG